eukprot:SAG11_NODE_6423_length_1317_cov_1.053366_2_plen_166_part_00
MRHSRALQACQRSEMTHVFCALASDYLPSSAQLATATIQWWLALSVVACAPGVLTSHGHPVHLAAQPSINWLTTSLPCADRCVPARVTASVPTVYAGTNATVLRYAAPEDSSSCCQFYCCGEQYYLNTQIDTRDANGWLPTSVDTSNEAARRIDCQVRAKSAVIT